MASTTHQYGHVRNYSNYLNVIKIDTYGLSRRRYSFEYTVLRILQYLYQKRDSYPISKYHILTKVSSATQRQDRITSILKMLVGKGWVTVLKTERASFYRITEEGEEAYSGWVKDFLEFARSIYHEEPSGTFSTSIS